MTKKTSKKTTGMATPKGTRVGIKEPGPELKKAKKPTGKPPKKIRMLISCANQFGSYEEGVVYDVPTQVPVDSARRWIRSGAAEKVA